MKFQKKFLIYHRWYGATFFEPNAARRVFPCFDEPEYKAEFDISINHHKNFTAVSNAKVRETTKPDENSRVITYFATTPRISPHNVAFIVFNFTSSSVYGTGHTLHITPYFLMDTNFALDVERKIQKQYEEVTGIPLEIKKMDLVALPYLEKDAMSSFGILFFR